MVINGRFDGFTERGKTACILDQGLLKIAMGKGSIICECRG